MSARTERGRRSQTRAEIVDFLHRWYHVPALAAIVSFMFWVRVQSYGNFIRGDGRPTLAAVDSWYHWRTTMYTVNNWPYTMPFEPWTGYPVGRYVGQFGTLFDQIIATIALIIGLGDPTQAHVLQAVLVGVPLMGALTAIPVYFIGRRLGGRLAGLGGAALLALFPGSFFFRSMVGQLDHHVAEVLFMTVAVLAIMVALSVAEREKPVWELFVDRDWHGLRVPALYAGLAGVAIGLYLWIWPAGVFLIGILGIFFVIKLAGDYVRGVSPDHIAFVGVVSLGVVAVMMLARLERPEMGATTFGLLHPALAIMVAAGCVFMAWLAREWDRRGYGRTAYPVAIAAGIVVALIAIRVGAPGLFETLVDNFLRRMTPIGEHATDLTIREAQPPSNPRQHVFDEFGLAFYTMILGLVLLAIRPFFGGEHRAERLFIVVWSLFLISMAFTQVRFNYYLAVAVAVVNAAVIGMVVRWADVPSTASLRNVDGYQVMTVVVVVMVLFVPLLPPVASATVIDRGAASGPSGDAIKWEGSNHWLAENSPPVGTWGGAGNEAALDYYGTYPIPEDGDFDYPAGTYGVMSWWDYGHLITVQAERIPHANPFQQHARSASAFLTAQSEERAERLLEALPAGRSVVDKSDDELDALIADRDEQQREEEIRYVMIDDSMAGGKFSAIATWTGSYGEFVETQRYDVGDNETISVPGPSDAYDDTMLSRLYFGDASGLERYRLVHESPAETTFVSVAARQTEGEWQPVAINRELTASLQAQLQQLIQHPSVEVELYEQRQAAAVKTFERVEGATITGTVDEPDENTTVAAAVTLNATSSNRTFTYIQETTPDDEGRFSLTVPYATSNDLKPEDGYTDTSVLAEGEYTIIAADEPRLVLGGLAAPSEQTTTAVPEGAIYGGETIEVDMEPVETVEATPDGGEEASDNGTDDADPDDGTNASDAGRIVPPDAT